jgi:predicted SprT family Zn-dependent metalloprotease
MDGFWSQDVVNDWNDEYSPRKAPKTQPRPLVSLDQSLSDVLSSPAKAKVNQAREERAAKAAWVAGKDKFAQDFFLELDEKLSSGEISRLAKSTGGVKIIWNSRLKSSAGQAKWKRAQISRGTNELPPVYEHHATIELADKVVINEEQLLNTLAHEFCHLCTMMIDGASDKPHGAVFKKWALACTRLFKARGVKVTTKHTYEIAYKFVWECTMCGTEYGRHSKSINPVQHRCSKCKGNLAQTKPAPRSAAASKPSIYQVFVKENMKKVRQENPGSPQKDIMRLLGQKYQKQKASNRQSQEPVVDTGMEVVTGDEGHGSADGSPNAASNDCLRKKLEDCCIIPSGE